MALNPTDGFRVAGWMRTELGLKGAELLTYALVHTFSQSNAGIYKGGVRYLASWIGCSYNTAAKYLKTLAERNLITEHPVYENNVRFCHYSINFGVLPQILGVHQILGEGSPKIGDRIEREENIYNTLSIKAQGKFQKPSVEEIRQYCQERGNTVDPEQFYDFYESNGWMVGKSHMKDWKASVRTWEKREKDVAPRKRETRRETVLEHNLREIDRMYGTSYHEQAYGKKEAYDEQ